MSDERPQKPIQKSRRDARFRCGAKNSHPGLAKVAETVSNIKGAWIKGTKVVVKDGAVAEWRVTLAVTFIVD